MSEEQIKELEKVVDMPRIEEYILQLQQENKELKRQDFKLKEMLKDKGKDTKFSQRLFEDTIQPNVLLRLKWLKEYGDNLNSDEIKEIE